MSNSNQDQAKQAGAAFDALAGQTTALFNRIQAQPVITAADLQAAQTAYQQLAQTVATAGAQVPYVKAQWVLPSYQAAYEARLQQIASKVAVDDPAGFATVVNSNITAGNGSVNAAITPESNGLLLLATAGVLIFLLVKR